MLFLSPALAAGSTVQGTATYIYVSPTPWTKYLLQNQGHGLRTSRAERAGGQLGHTLDQEEALKPPVGNKVAMVAEPADSMWLVH